MVSTVAAPFRMFSLNCQMQMTIEATAKLDSLRKASMTIVLYAEDDIKTLRQMFVDASKAKRIEGNTVTRFDRRNAFNLAAVWLAENSRLFEGRVEMERSTIAASSPDLFTINQLVAIVKSLEVGYGRWVSRDLNEDLYARPPRSI